jgi:uncharacterized protein YbaP (TraB family)
MPESKVSVPASRQRKTVREPRDDRRKQRPMTMLRRLAILLLVLGVAAPARAEPALWVARSATATVYLFGTVHLLKDNLPWRSPRIDRALAASGDLWLEVANASDPAAMLPFVRQYGIDPAHPLSTKLTDAERNRLKNLIDRGGLPGITQLETFRPWMAALLISITELTKAGYDPKQGVEKILATQMTDTGRTVLGLETIEAQFRYFTQLPPKAEVEMLDEAMDDAEEGLTKFNTIVAAWLAGDVDSIGRLFDEEMAAKQPDAYRALIVDRNIAWTTQLRDRLKGNGVSFVAVGAAHLAGPDSVQAQLAKVGIEVRRE